MRSLPSSVPSQAEPHNVWRRAWVSPVMVVSIAGTNSLLPDSVVPIESKSK